MPLGDAPVVMRPRKSLTVAYLLWLSGGVFGVHLLYLDRDAHALLHLTSFGGWLGLGWLRDLFRLPEYVRRYNRDAHYCEDLQITYRRQPSSPPRSTAVLLSQIAFAVWYGELGSHALQLLAPHPEPPLPMFNRSTVAWLGAMLTIPLLLRVASAVLHASGVACGVWMAGNASRSQYARYLPIFLCTLAAEVAPYLLDVSLVRLQQEDAADSLPMWTVCRQYSAGLWTIVVAVYAYTQTRTWSAEAADIIEADVAAAGVEITVVRTTQSRSTRRHRGFCSRLLRLSAALWLSAFLMTSSLLHVRVDRVPIKVPIRDFLQSAQFQDLLSRVHQQWAFLRTHGYERWLHEAKAALGDIDSAYEALELDPKRKDEYSMAQVKRERNRLALKYHPDKATDTKVNSLTKELRQDKFHQIQRAYERIKHEVDRSTRRAKEK